MSPGNTTISIQFGSVAASATLTVAAGSAGFHRNQPGCPDDFVRNYTAIYSHWNYSDGTTQDLTATAAWGSSNATVAVIANDGWPSSAGTGTATISATSRVDLEFDDADGRPRRRWFHSA